MEQAERLAEAIKTTLQGVGEGAVHGIQVASGMESASTVTTTHVSGGSSISVPGTNTAIPTTHPGRPIPVSAPITINEPAKATQGIVEPESKTRGPIESIKENIEEMGEKLKVMTGHGIDKTIEGLGEVKREAKEAAQESKAKIGRTMEGSGDSIKETGRALGKS